MAFGFCLSGPDSSSRLATDETAPNLLRAPIDWTAPDYSLLFIQLGSVAVGLAVLARLARRWGLSAISLFLLAGLAFGKGGIAPLNLTKDFIQLGAEIGVLLLLFMLGLEYSGEQLTNSLRKGLSGAGIDLLLNFPPGFIAGILLGWSLLPSFLLGGITLISSSGIIARVLSELDRMNAPETPTVLSILVLEDLMMAVYLPLVAVLLPVGTDQNSCFGWNCLYGGSRRALRRHAIRTLAQLLHRAPVRRGCSAHGLRYRASGRRDRAAPAASRPRLAHFLWELPSQARSVSNRIACLRRCAISSLQLSFSSSDWRSTREACRRCS